MKLTNADLIRNREKALLETISGDLDRDSIRRLLEAKYHLDLDGESLVCRDGDLVVHDNQVAYKVQFQAMVSLSLMFNRQGECLEADLFSALAAPQDQASEAPGNDAYAAVSSTGQVAAEPPDNGAPEDIAAGQNGGEAHPESGAYAYAYAHAGKETEAVIPDNGAYGAVDTVTGPEAEPSDDLAGTAPEAEADFPGTLKAELPDTGGDAPPSARMASSIAEMISEINKT